MTNNNIESKVTKIIFDQLDGNEEQLTLGASFLDDLGPIP
jgi:acyl carrier protein